MSDIGFHPGERLQWRSRDNTDAPLMLRQVEFIERNNTREATIAFGLRSDGSGEPDLYRVPLVELRRPPEPPAPAFQPKPAAKPGITVPDLIPLRSQLRAAIEARTAAQTNVNAASATVQHAEAALADAQNHLADVTAQLGEQREAKIEAMRRGAQVDGHDADAGVALRVAAEGDAEIAEAAVERFRSELRQARDVLYETNARVTSAALKIVAAIADREGAALAQLESEAAARRAELKAFDSWLTGEAKHAISAPLATFLANPPEPVPEPVGFDHRASADRRRTARWRDLFDRLQANADAEF